VLRLRGCRLLSDTSIRRFLLSCPGLTTLDIADIPKLSNAALKAPAEKLGIFVAGTFTRPMVPQVDDRRQSGIQSIAVAGEGWAETRTKEVAGTCKFSPCLQFQGPVSGPPLTHLVLASCPDLSSLPFLPNTLKHLDFRGCPLSGPAESNLGQWKPLSACRHLEVLSLSGCRTLSATALSTMLQSLPSETRLKVLDISETSVDIAFLRELPTLHATRRISHLRMAGCSALTDSLLRSILLAFREILEVVDISYCQALDGLMWDTCPSLPKLRYIAIKQTCFAAESLVRTREALQRLAPSAIALVSPIDIFRDYSQLPPSLL